MGGVACSPISGSLGSAAARLPQAGPPCPKLDASPGWVSRFFPAAANAYTHEESKQRFQSKDAFMLVQRRKSPEGLLTEV